MSLSFTRSPPVNLLTEFGQRYGFSREDMAFVDIRTVLNLYAHLTSCDVADILKLKHLRVIETGGDSYVWSCRIRGCASYVQGI